MNRTDEKYTRFALTREMLETPGILAGFDAGLASHAADAVAAAGRLFMTGEGSSRIFPAKNAIAQAMAAGMDLCAATEGACQAGEYALDDYVVFAASNSGRTQEVISLFKQLKARGHRNLFALTANRNTALEDLADKTYILTCGAEEAVAATKSLMEQALFYQALLSLAAGRPLGGLEELAANVETALTMAVPGDLVDAVAKAGTIYFAGYNNGVAEELTLKANEIVRKRSDFLEGTYAFHGAQEVMDSDDLVIIAEPIAGQEARFAKILGEDVGMRILAISSRDTMFETLKIPVGGVFGPYVQMAAGWNLLVEAGLALGIDLDKPERARKVADDITSRRQDSAGRN